MAEFNKDSVLGGGRLAITAERVEGLDQRIDDRIDDQTYTKLQNIKTELLVIAPTLVLTNTALKNAWTLASTQSLEV